MKRRAFINTAATGLALVRVPKPIWLSASSFKKFDGDWLLVFLDLWTHYLEPQMWLQNRFPK